MLYLYSKLNRGYVIVESQFKLSKFTKEFIIKFLLYFIHMSNLLKMLL